MNLGGGEPAYAILALALHFAYTQLGQVNLKYSTLIFISQAYLTAFHSQCYALISPSLRVF